MKKTIMVMLIATLGMWGCNHNNSAEQVGKEVDTIEVQKEESPHLEFDDIAIAGLDQEYAEKLVRKGYALDVDYLKELNTYRLIGEYMGYEDCEVYLNSTIDGHLMYGVQVIFPKRDKWDDLYADYKVLKGKMTELYGEPMKCLEDFNEQNAPQTEADKMEVFRKNNGTFGAMYETDKGYVNVYIEPWNRVLGLNYCHATVYFVDYLNYDNFVTESKNGAL